MHIGSNMKFVLQSASICRQQQQQHQTAINVDLSCWLFEFVAVLLFFSLSLWTRAHLILILITCITDFVSCRTFQLVKWMCLSWNRRQQHRKDVSEFALWTAGPIVIDKLYIERKKCERKNNHHINVASNKWRNEHQTNEMQQQQQWTVETWWLSISGQVFQTRFSLKCSFIFSLASYNYFFFVIWLNRQSSISSVHYERFGSITSILHWMYMGTRYQTYRTHISRSLHCFVDRETHTTQKW